MQRFDYFDSIKIFVNFLSGYSDMVIFYFEYRTSIYIIFITQFQILFIGRVTIGFLWEFDDIYDGFAYQHQFIASAYKDMPHHQREPHTMMICYICIINKSGYVALFNDVLYLHILMTWQIDIDMATMAYTLSNSF